MIIPTKNSAPMLRRLIDSIRVQNIENIEVIVVDNYSSDETSEIATASGVKFFSAGPERSSQRNFGALIAQYDVLLFIDSDMELSDGIIRECIIGIEHSDALCLREVISAGKDFWGRVRAFERASYFMSTYFEAARCIKKEVFSEVGGYDTALTGLEDMALQARLLRNRARIGWVNAPLIHHEESLTLMHYLRKRERYGKTDRVFASLYPEFWRVLRSPTKRLCFAMRYLINSKEFSLIGFLFGLMFLRIIEVIIRS